jgi:hypothetical protein
VPNVPAGSETAVDPRQLDFARAAEGGPVTEAEDVLAELAAAVAFVGRHHPAAIVLRVSSDRQGTVRVVVERLEGVSLAALGRPLREGVE